MKEFIDFIRKQGVVGLAIGFLLGGAVSSLVTSLVEDLINPLLSLLLGPAQAFEDFVLPVAGVQVRIGSFIASLIDFLIIAFIVYFVFQGLSLEKLDKEKK